MQQSSTDPNQVKPSTSAADDADDIEELEPLTKAQVQAMSDDELGENLEIFE